MLGSFLTPIVADEGCNHMHDLPMMRLQYENKDMLFVNKISFTTYC